MCTGIALPKSFTPKRWIPMATESILRIRVLALKRETHFTNTIASDAQPVLRGISICRPARRRLPVARPRRLCVRYSGVCLKPPAFQFYVDDFLGGTLHFSDAEKGLYITLLCAQWSAGSLPDDDDELATFSNGNTPLKRVKSKFQKGEDGRLRNQRLEIERQKQIAFRESRFRNGSRGGRPKASGLSEKPSDNLVVLKTEPTESSPVSSLQSPVSNSVQDVADLLQKLGEAIYARKEGQRASEFEERLALGVLNRPGWSGELQEIMAFNRIVPVEDRRFEIPKTLVRLLEEWNGVLDKARTFQPRRLRNNGAPDDYEQKLRSGVVPFQ